MDEVLVNVAIDLGGRPAFAYDLTPSERIGGEFDTTLMPHFRESLAQTGRHTLHVTQVPGGNPHHLLEATMKALGRGIDPASRHEPRRFGFATPLRDARERGVPILGICVGMQLLFDRSEEDAGEPGLGFYRGSVVKLTGVPRVPQIGWNAVRRIGDHPWLRDVADG